MIQSRHRSQPMPQGALELERPFGIVPNWDNGARPLYLQTYKSLMWATSVEEIEPWKRHSPWLKAIPGEKLVSEPAL